MHKRLYFTGVAAYILLLVFSVLFYKERTILNDAAYNLFYIIKDGAFCFPGFRFGEAFTQVFPLVGRLFSASLEHILVLYSSGFIIFYFACYLVAGSLLKQYSFALCIILFHTLFASESFYYIPSALIQGTTFLLVALAFVARYRESNSTLITATSVFLAVITAFFHPLMVFVVGYSLLFFLLDRQLVLPTKQIIRFAIVFIVTLLLKSLLLRLPYETHALGGLRNFVTRFPDYFSLYSHKRFLHKCLTEYYWIPVVFVLVMIFYLVRKEIRKALLVTISVVGYYFLVSISYPDAATPAFYMENIYMPLAIFLLLPLCFDLAAMARPELVNYLCIVIIITGCLRIVTVHKRYTARLNWERRFMIDHPGQKLIFPAKLVPIDTLVSAWGTPYEFWLLSTLENGHSASIIIDDKPEDRTWAAYTPAALVVNWYLYPYKELNPKYFIFNDSTSGYKVVPAQQQ